MARVLLVDDDSDGLEIRRLVLERHGHSVTCACDAGAARAQFRAAAPDSVILDLRLPGVEDGLALIRDFRAAAPNMRIVALAGWIADLDGREERIMVDQILSKPVHTESLLRLIASG